MFNRIYRKAPAALAVIMAFVLTVNLFAGTAVGAINFHEQDARTLNIVVLSDPHIFPMDMVGDPDSPEFGYAVSMDRKMLAESTAIFDAAVEKVKARNPYVLLIPGDLTKDGEYASREYLADRLAELQAALPNLKIYVINGNHDINNRHAFDYSSGVAVPARTVTAEEFRYIYEGFGYGDATSEYYVPSFGEAGSNSYVARPTVGFTIIAVDACKYSADITPSGTDYQVTSGVITAELLAWITEKTAEAKANGDTVIVFQHHGVIPHYSTQLMIAPEYVIDNWQEAGEAYADAGIRYVFSGHGHAQSIVSAEYNGNTIYDVETNSLVTYPSPIRYVTVTAGLSVDGYEAEQADITTDYITEVFFNGEWIEDFTAYGRENSVDAETLLPSAIGQAGSLISDVLAPLLSAEYTPEDSGVTHYGSRALIENMLGGDMGNYAVSMLSSMLPTSANPMPLDLGSYSARLYYDANNRRVTVDVLGSLLGMLYMTDDNIKRYLIDETFTRLDRDFLNNNAYITGVFIRSLDALCRQYIDDEHTFYDLAAYAYLTNIDGTTGQLEPWAAAAMYKLVAGGLMDELMAAFNEQLAEEFLDMFRQIPVNYNSLITTGGLLGGTIKSAAVSSLPDNVYDFLGMFGVGIDDLAGGSMDGMFGDTGVDMMLLGLLDSFMNPYGYPENNNATLAWTDGFVGFDITITGVSNGNRQSNVDFGIRSANGKGYTTYISLTGEYGTFSPYSNVNYNSKGAHVKGLANGATYYVFFVYDSGATFEISGLAILTPGK